MNAKNQNIKKRGKGPVKYCKNKMKNKIQINKCAISSGGNLRNSFSALRGKIEKNR